MIRGVAAGLTPARAGISCILGREWASRLAAVEDREEILAEVQKR